MRISQRITDAHFKASSTYHRARTYMKGEARATNCRFKKKKRQKERSTVGAAFEQPEAAQLFEGRQTRGEGRHAAKDPDEINIHEEEGGTAPPKTRRTLARVMMRLTLSFNIKHPTRILHQRRVTVNESV